MSSGYSSQAVAAFFDGYASGEWERLDRDAHARVIGHLHGRFLAEVIRPGAEVLDAGCGAGRFALQCLQAGAKVALLDISRVQLDLALRHCEAVREGITAVHEADITDLSGIGPASFDVVVCYGSVLCYVLERASDAVAQLARALRPGGSLVLSVGSRTGLLRYTVANPKLDPAGFFGRPEYWHIDRVLASGDLPAHPEVAQPPRHFFTSGEVRDLLRDAGLQDLKLGTAPGISSGLCDRLSAIERSEAAWNTLLSLEERTYCEPGLVDAGEFILARGTRPNASSG